MATKPSIPAHSYGWKCADCIAWRDMNLKMALDPGGIAVPFNAQTPLNWPRVNMGICQMGPRWEQQPSDSYCWSFKAKLAS